MIAAVSLLAFAPASAFASQMIDRNATHVSIAVNSQHRAEVTYRSGGAWHHVLVWGAINALRAVQGRTSRSSSASTTPAAMAASARRYWKSIAATTCCGPYTGPPLAWKVVACTTPNGQNWALQAWQRLLPNSGERPKRGAPERMGAAGLALDRAAARAVAQVGLDLRRPVRPPVRQVLLRGLAVHGFTHTSTGNPTDSYGRNIYVDTLDPPEWTTGYRQAGGWMRFNSFLTHHIRGNFCAGVYTNMFGRGPAGTGSAYRATAMGPGVTPIVTWEGPGPGHYAPAGSRPRRTACRTTTRCRHAPSSTGVGYSVERDAKFTAEERAVAGAGDSCSASAGK